MGHLTDARLVGDGESGVPIVTTEVGIMTETFQISLEQAEAYEELFVPAVFGQWVPALLDIAGVAPGQRVLDVACGTGVVARAAAERIADARSVVGLDLNPAMLEVARRVCPDIEWRQADVADLPFGDREFDAVLCQSALFFFPDPRAALNEMTRVVKEGGVVAIQTYASLDAQPGYIELVDNVVRHAGEDARSLLDTYWSQGDLPALCSTMERTGLRIEETRTKLGTARYGSVENLVDIEVKGTPLVDRLTDATIDQILAESRDALREFTTPEGTLELPIRAHLVAARRTG